MGRSRDARSRRRGCDVWGLGRPFESRPFTSLTMAWLYRNWLIRAPSWKEESPPSPSHIWVKILGVAIHSSLCIKSKKGQFKTASDMLSPSSQLTRKPEYPPPLRYQEIASLGGENKKTKRLSVLQFCPQRVSDRHFHLCVHATSSPSQLTHPSRRVGTSPSSICELDPNPMVPLISPRKHG